MAVNKSNIEIIITGGGQPAARLGDAVYAYGTGKIIQGSPTVSIGTAPSLNITPNNSSPEVGDELPKFDVIIYDEEFILKNEMA